MHAIVLLALQDVVRVPKKDFDSQRAKMYGTQDLWYHIDCFVENRDETGFDPGLDPTKYAMIFIINIVYCSYGIVFITRTHSHVRRMLKTFIV